MATVLIFFVRLATPTFILLAIGLLFAIQRLSRSYKERSAAVFGLEREIATRHMSQAISAMVLVSLISIAEFFLVVFLYPNTPWLEKFATPTMNPLLTTTSTFPLEFMETLGVVTPNSLTETPSPTGCIPGQIDITSPKPGNEIQGSITLQGSANIPNFGFYKYEFSPVGIDNWATIVAYNKPIQDGELGVWDTSAITTGDYLLRLVVTDNQGAEFPACIIPVRIKAP